jgi:hypothetical protein
VSPDYLQLFPRPAARGFLVLGALISLSLDLSLFRRHTLEGVCALRCWSARWRSWRPWRMWASA